jgi:co-chaperonin GroES (HSP10)
LQAGGYEPMIVKRGDWVMYNSGGAMPIRIDDKDLKLLQEGQILAIINRK